jgi:hypothetical protein
MQRQVQGKIQNTQSSTDSENDLLPKIKDWINTRYQRIYRSHYWSESIDDYVLTLVASQSEYAFDRDFERLISVFDQKNGHTITIQDLSNHVRNYASTYDKSSNLISGDPSRLRITGIHVVKVELTQKEKISVISSNNTTDISPNCVRVFGKSNGIEIGENIVLTGTTKASGSIEYDSGQKITIAVGTTDGTRKSVTGAITVTGTTSTAVLAQISPVEISHKYTWFKVSPTPKADGTQPTWEIWYQKAWRPLIDDNDIPIFDCCVEVVQGAFADALREDGLEEESQLAEQMFVSMVTELKATRDTPGQIHQFMPVGSPYPRFDNDSYQWIP